MPGALARVRTLHLGRVFPETNNRKTNLLARSARVSAESQAHLYCFVRALSFAIDMSSDSAKAMLARAAELKAKKEAKSARAPASESFLACVARVSAESQAHHYFLVRALSFAIEMSSDSAEAMLAKAAELKAKKKRKRESAQLLSHDLWLLLQRPLVRGSLLMLQLVLWVLCAGVLVEPLMRR